MNRRPLWVDLRHVAVNKRLPFLAAARQAKADALVVAKDDPYATRDDLAIHTVDAKHVIRDGPKAIGKEIHLRNAADQKRAATAKDIVIVASQDWRVIPLENLIAQRGDKPGTLFARATSRQEAVLFADTLQVGPHGIVLAPHTPQDIADVHAELLARPVRPVGPSASTSPNPQTAQMPQMPQMLVKQATTQPSHAKGPASAKPAESVVRPAAQRANIKLSTARITAIEDAQLGDRVCIDTTSMLEEGEGILVGGTAGSLALVLAETPGSQFIAARPFRVNAGAVSNYVLAPDGRTLYLSELTSGRVVVGTNRAGQQRPLTLGRAKIEKRPHLLVRWQGDAGKGHVVLQTAETVALAGANGERLPVTSAAIGDMILVAAQPKARHAGTAVAADAEER